MARLVLVLSALLVSSTAAAQSASIQPIINGRAATEGEIHGTVAIVDGTTGYFFCSGTLVSPKVVVTAAHCFFDEMGVRQDETNFLVVIDWLDLNVEPPSEDIVEVEHGRPHPGFFLNPFGDELPNGLDPTAYDIGYLVLRHDVDHVTPVSIATEREAEEALSVGTTLTLAGYGVTDLAATTVGVLMQTTATLEILAEIEMMVHPSDATQGDSCYGDSGGPAYATIDSDLRLVGVTSRGRLDSTLECGGGGIYTLAAPFREWLAEQSGDPRVAPRADGGRCEASRVGGATTPGLSSIAIVALVLLGTRRSRLTGSAARGSGLRPRASSARTRARPAAVR